MQLYNKFDKETLRKKLESETFKRITFSFYRYVIIDDPHKLRDELYIQWSNLGCLGRIYLANEGINAQMNVPEHHFEAFKEQLYADSRFKDIPFKIAIEDNGKSFLKLTIKVRKNIVADGLPPGTYDVTNVGKHLTAREFNEALEMPDTIVVDMRNHYESEIGHFEKAICPDADTFKQELPMVAEMLKGKEDKKILLYCTGGIRCEKASAYLKHLGFKDVNQLYGGIIEYARQVKNEGLENKFHGKNFVFDERLGERISEEIISNCHQCGKPCDTHTNCKNDACHLLFIQCEECAKKYEGCCSTECKDFMHLPREKQIKLRKGTNLGQNIYRKGRIRPKLTEAIRLTLAENQDNT